jgi:hypothetical protein
MPCPLISLTEYQDLFPRQSLPFIQRGLVPSWGGDSPGVSTWRCVLRCVSRCRNHDGHLQMTATISRVHIWVNQKSWQCREPHERIFVHPSSLTSETWLLQSNLHFAISSGKLQMGDYADNKTYHGLSVLNIGHKLLFLSFSTGSNIPRESQGGIEHPAESFPWVSSPWTGRTVLEGANFAEHLRQPSGEIQPQSVSEHKKLIALSGVKALYLAGEGPSVQFAEIYLALDVESVSLELYHYPTFFRSSKLPQGVFSRYHCRSPSRSWSAH